MYFSNPKKIVAKLNQMRVNYRSKPDFTRSCKKFYGRIVHGYQKYVNTIHVDMAKDAFTRY